MLLLKLFYFLILFETKFDFNYVFSIHLESLIKAINRFSMIIIRSKVQKKKRT